MITLFKRELTARTCTRSLGNLVLLLTTPLPSIGGKQVLMLIRIQFQKIEQASLKREAPEKIAIGTCDILLRLH